MRNVKLCLILFSSLKIAQILYLTTVKLLLPFRLILDLIYLLIKMHPDYLNGNKNKLVLKEKILVVQSRKKYYKSFDSALENINYSI